MGRALDLPVRRLPIGPPERRTPASYAGAVLAPLALRGADVALLNGLSTQRVVPALALLGKPALLFVNNPLRRPPEAWGRPYFWRRVRAISAASDHVAAECVAAGAPREIVHTVYPAAWAGLDPPGTGARPPAGQRVLFVGQLEARKGVSDLIEAARGFLSGRPDATLTIAGEAGNADDAYVRGLRAAAARPELEGRVRFTGFVDDVAAAMLDHDLVVVPSLEEPYGTVSAEAAAAGRPAIVSAVGGMREVVSDGETGLHVPAGDPRALATAVGALLDDGARMRAMAARALELCRRFSPSAYASRIDELLGGVIGDDP
jgi:glycosyltransferase involved in cell wall biosynthesis